MLDWLGLVFPPGMERPNQWSSRGEGHQLPGCPQARADGKRGAYPSEAPAALRVGRGGRAFGRIREHATQFADPGRSPGAAAGWATDVAQAANPQAQRLRGGQASA